MPRGLRHCDRSPAAGRPAAARTGCRGATRRAVRPHHDLRPPPPTQLERKRPSCPTLLVEVRRSRLGRRSRATRALCAKHRFKKLAKPEPYSCSERTPLALRAPT
eukprot:3690048-Prymnesium_polylepis.1